MDWIFLLISIGSGIILSLIYFGGLWFTIKRMVQQNWPAWTVFASFVARISLVLLVFYALVIQHWLYLIIALSAFVIVRQILIKRIGKPGEALYG